MHRLEADEARGATYKPKSGPKNSMSSKCPGVKHPATAAVHSTLSSQLQVEEGGVPPWPDLPPQLEEEAALDMASERHVLGDPDPQPDNPEVQDKVNPQKEFFDS